MRRPRNVAQFAVLALIALFAILLLQPPLKSTSTAAPVPLDRKRYIATLEEQLRARLNDPESARFRGERVLRHGQDAIVCGEVNVRNELGGYDGFRRFIAGPDFMRIETGPDASEVAKRWDELCMADSAPRR